MTRPRVFAVVLLAGAMLSGALPPTAEGQRGPRGRPGGGREHSAEPVPEPAPGPGEYSLDFDRVLEAINRGEGHQALAYYERTAAKADQDGDRLLSARALGAVAVTARRLGLWQKAIQAGARAIDLFKSAAGLGPADRRGLATAYVQVGSAYGSAGDFAQSRTTLEEGLRFAESQLGGRREGMAVGTLLMALARTAYAQRDYQRALKVDTQAAHVFEDFLADLPSRAPEGVKTRTHRHVAVSLTAVGRDQLALGHPDEAEAAFDRALKEARLIGLAEVELRIVEGQGKVALARQDWSKAVGFYERGLVLGNQIKSTGALALLYSGRARALSALGRSDEALAASREAVGAIEQLRGGLGDSELRSEFLDHRQMAYQLAVRLALDAQRAEEAFSFAERSRARAFLDLLGSQTTLSKGRTRALVDEEVKLRARLAEAQAQAQETDEPGESKRARALAEAADRDYRAFLARVRKENLEQASLMTVEPVTLAEIQALLPERTTLLEYLVTDNEIVLWVVDRQGARVLRSPGGRQSLNTQVRRFRAAIANQVPLGDIELQARALHDRLLGAARPEIRGDRLLIVPHGILHYLPFGALRSPAGRWLVEDFALSTLPSASVLRYLADKGVGAPVRALVVGNPDLGPNLELPWAQREARMVGDREHEATVLVRGAATEAQVKKLVESAGLIHFATHGDLSPSDPLSAALLLVPGEGEDGRLEVRELFGLDLHAWLVVLSACETGLGALNHGDEMVGLQRAFLYAGTPAVVTTLWKIDDRASYELIRAFYDHLSGAGSAEALRQAQRETMRTFPHPFAWAAFGLTGIPK